MKMPKKELIDVLKKTGIFAVVIISLAFIFYQSLDPSHVRAVTTPAVLSAEYERVTLEGAIFRDESVLYSQNSGAVVYNYSDGELVPVGSELCRVYNVGETYEYLAERGRIEKQIVLIERSIALGRNNAGGITNTKEALDSSYSALMEALRSGRPDEASDVYDDFLVALSANRLISTGDDGLYARLTGLNGRLEAFEKCFVGEYESMTTDEACYLFYRCDGYEEIFDISLLGSLDADGLSDMLGRASSGTAESGRGYKVGKTVRDFEWSLALAAPRGICGRFEVGRVYEVSFEDGTVIRMTLERVSDGEDGVLIFTTGIMPEGFEYKRVQSVSVLLGSTEGYRVPCEAIHSVDGKEGVFILSGSEVLFRRIKPIGSGDGYFVVSERDMSDEDYAEFLNLNDQIIISVSRGELYAGRVLD